ncbi:hypothetical protein SEA_SPEEDDEMON_1350 [Gordonia phage SpeedDemon]|uniref:Uncharacterized protein n=1 Tax=Gordonia phage Bantam TaxID=1887641 RepID=A0A1B3AYL4_9CAUD|nr:hypothetical protein BIZ77_gp047 [Gordonia phage Bantam]AOE43821.1 hypothetical protein SEA_BANTAM_132 [Gordonia phage Bantam]QNL30585.1 hypothetical protein SEA_SPEEDDEMON_1350 [Gordonia phage SpeedDemon]
MKVEDITQFHTLDDAEREVIASISELNGRAKRAGEAGAVESWTILHRLIDEDLEVLDVIREGRREEYRKLHRQLTPKFSSPPTGVQ